MKKLYIITCGLLLAGFFLSSLPVAVGAMSPAPTIILTAEQTETEGVPGDVFWFEVTIENFGKEARTFDLTATGPEDWPVSITPVDQQDVEIKNIFLYPRVKDTIVVKVSAPLTAVAGNYDIEFQGVGSGLGDYASVSFKVLIVAPYGLWLKLDGGLYNATVQAGQDNLYSIVVQNQGTAGIYNLTFDKSVPTGWTIEFNPDNLFGLGSGEELSVTMNVKPPKNAIPGDYQVSLSAIGNETSSNSLDIRLTVPRIRLALSNIWGWVGIGIVSLIVVVLIVMISVRVKPKTT